MMVSSAKPSISETKSLRPFFAHFQRVDAVHRVQDDAPGAPCCTQSNVDEGFHGGARYHAALVPLNGAHGGRRHKWKNKRIAQAGPQPSLADFRIVLVEPQHPGNIGGAGAGDENDGARRFWRWCAPSAFQTRKPSGAPPARWTCSMPRAVFDCLDDAIADCGLVAGTSARSRPHSLADCQCGRVRRSHGGRWSRRQVGRDPVRARGQRPRQRGTATLQLAHGEFPPIPPTHPSIWRWPCKWCATSCAKRCSRRLVPSEPKVPPRRRLGPSVGQRSTDWRLLRPVAKSAGGHRVPNRQYAASGDDTAAPAVRTARRPTRLKVAILRGVLTPR